jgi:hypothetical protein
VSRLRLDELCCAMNIDDPAHPAKSKTRMTI